MSFSGKKCKTSRTRKSDPRTGSACLALNLDSINLMLPDPKVFYEKDKGLGGGVGGGGCRWF